MKLFLNTFSVFIVLLSLGTKILARDIPRVRDIMGIAPTNFITLANGAKVYGYFTKSRSEFLDVNWTKRGGFIGENVRVEGWEKNGKLILKEASIGPMARVWGTVTLEGKVNIYDNAQVYGNAKISGILSRAARVYGNARVSGNAFVHGAWIYDRAHVYGDSWVSWEAKIFGKAIVAEKAKIDNFAKVYDDAQVFGNAKVYDNAKVFGKAKVYEDAEVYGNAKVYDDARVFGNAKVYRLARVYKKAKVYEDAKVSGNAWVTCELFGEDHRFGFMPDPDPSLVEARNRREAEAYRRRQRANDDWIRADGLLTKIERDVGPIGWRQFRPQY